MEFKLLSKVVIKKDGKEEKKFTNFYLEPVGAEYSRLPITIKVIKKGDKILNKSDYIFALKVAERIKENEKEN